MDEVGDHHLPPAPEAPDRPREDDRAVHDLPVAGELGAVELREQGEAAVEQVPGLAQPPGVQRVVPRHAQGEDGFAVAPQPRLELAHERGLARVRVEGDQEVHGLVEHGQDARVVRGVLPHEPLQVEDGGAHRAVVVVPHADRGERAHAQGRLGDHAELAVAQEHALEELRVALLGALHDLPGRSHHLQGHRLVGGEPEPGGVDVHPAHPQGASDAGGEVEGRREVVEALPAQRLGERVPVDAAFDADGHPLAVDGEHAAHPRHVEQDAAEGHRLALGREAAAAHRDRDRVLLGEPEELRHLGGRAGEQDDVREPVGHAARVGEVEGARGPPRAKLETRRPGLGGERAEALALPARGQRLQALQEGQGVRGHRIGREDAARGGRDLEGRAHAGEILAEADRPACGPVLTRPRWGLPLAAPSRGAGASLGAERVRRPDVARADEPTLLDDAIVIW